jgi:hypothetical protein
MAACAGKKLDILIAYSGNASNGRVRFGKKHAAWADRRCTDPVRYVSLSQQSYSGAAGGGWLIADQCGLTAPARHLL